MNTYHVDFSRETLRRDKQAPARLMRDIRRIAKDLGRETARPRYVWKRRTDQSRGYWFQFADDLHKKPEVAKLLEPYGWRQSSAPLLPASEWQEL